MKWFWADLHFEQGETLITKLGRPATSPEEWCERCVDGINRNVKKSDCLYLLGDFAFGRLMFWRQRIKCRCFLIIGNHDVCVSKIRHVFGDNYARDKIVKCCGIKTHVYHYPLAFWEGSHRGEYHLYGHIHADAPKEAMMDRFMPGRRSMCTSPESSLDKLGEMRPFSEEDVHAILSQRAGHDSVPYVPPA